MRLWQLRSTWKINKQLKRLWNIVVATAPWYIHYMHHKNPLNTTTLFFRNRYPTCCSLDYLTTRSHFLAVNNSSHLHASCTPHDKSQRNATSSDYALYSLWLTRYWCLHMPGRHSYVPFSIRSDMSYAYVSSLSNRPCYYHKYLRWIYAPHIKHGTTSISNLPNCTAYTPWAKSHYADIIT